MDSLQSLALIGIIALGILISLSILGSGSTDISETAKRDCISLCLNTSIRNETFGYSPCLSNNIAEDWVCDIAHNPREFSDGLLENQCSAILDGYAHHFIEVDPGCNFIRSY